MDVPEVDKKMLSELESMGFPTVRATRALFYLGNCNLEDAINWIIEHDHNPDIDQMPQVVNIEIESVEPSLLPQELKIKAQELEMRVHKKKEEEKRMEREREKERIQVGKAVLETKKIAEENERKRVIEFRKAEKKEEKRARENVLRKLEQDKTERRRKLGLRPDKLVATKSTTPMHEKNAQHNSSLSIKNTSDAENMMDCLRSLKKNHKDDDAKVGRAFQTLLIYVGNVVKNPDIEKFRKIRLSNPLFQDRVGSLKGGIEFLKLCGFEMLGDNEFLFLPRDKVDIRLLNKAGTVLHSAMNNPYFGIF